MQNGTIERLFAYWDKARGEKTYALRSAINPSQVKSDLPWIFMLEKTDGGLRFRLAGTRLCAFYRHELRDTGFNDLWDQSSSATAENAALRALSSIEPVSMECDFQIEADTVYKARMILLPLSSNGERPDRLLGALDLGASANSIRFQAFTKLRLTSTQAPAYPEKSQAVAPASAISHPSQLDTRENTFHR